MLWIKLLHVATISIWSAGLICLPGLYVQRTHVPDDESLHRLQGMVRFLYVAIVSPAAFIAVGSGTALIFLREAWVPWFSVKLVFVGAMVVIHILTGLVIIKLFEKGQPLPGVALRRRHRCHGACRGDGADDRARKPDVPNLLPDGDVGAGRAQPDRSRSQSFSEMMRPMP
jgi:putative membrane protein